MTASANHTETNPFLEGPILSPLVRFALPLMLSLVLQAFYGAVDLAVVGRFSPTASAAAVATGSQTIHTVTMIITGLAMGVTVLLGRLAGSGKLQEAGKLIAGQIKLFVIVSVLLTVSVCLLAPTITQWMQVPEQAVPETIGYLRICAIGFIFICAYNGISAVFRGLGNSRTPFLFVCIACAVNVVLDLVFVAGFGLDAYGAALATVIAQACSVIFSLLYMKTHPLPFPISRKDFADGSFFAILRVGGPIAAQDFWLNVSFLMITGIVNSLGLVASAGIGIAEKSFLFLSIIPAAFMSALSAFVAQNIGADKPQRAVRSLFIGQGISFFVGFLIFLLTFFAGDILASLFENDPDVIAATARYLHGCSLEYLSMPLIYCFLGYFNGKEHTTFVMAQGLFTAFFVRIPLSYFLSRLPGADLFTISIAVPVSSFFSLFLCIGYFLLLQKKENRHF